MAKTIHLDIGETLTTSAGVIILDKETYPRVLTITENSASTTIKVETGGWGQLDGDGVIGPGEIQWLTVRIPFEPLTFAIFQALQENVSMGIDKLYLDHWGTKWLGTQDQWDKVENQLGKINSRLATVIDDGTKEGLQVFPIDDLPPFQIRRVLLERSTSHPTVATVSLVYRGNDNDPGEVRRKGKKRTP